MQRYFRQRSRAAAAALAALTLVAQPAVAEQLSPYWQAQRDYFNKLSDDACDGDGEAYQTLVRAAQNDDHPVAQNDLAWVLDTKRCAYFVGDKSLSTDYMRQSAANGYPLGMSNYAFRLMKGTGVTAYPDLALRYYDAAILLGYGEAAIELSEFYLDGTGVPRNEARAHELYQTARDLGADEEKLAKLAERLGLGDAQKYLHLNQKWSFSGGAANVGKYDGDRLEAVIYLIENPNGQGVRMEFVRENFDPVVHVMSVKVEVDGKVHDVDIGECFGDGCIELSDDGQGRVLTMVTLDWGGWSAPGVLDLLKRGQRIGFNFQTRGSLAEQQYYSYAFSLKGSRKAIEALEADMAD